MQLADAHPSLRVVERHRPLQRLPDVEHRAPAERPGVLRRVPQQPAAEAAASQVGRHEQPRQQDQPLDRQTGRRRRGRQRRLVLGPVQRDVADDPPVLLRHPGGDLVAGAEEVGDLVGRQVEGVAVLRVHLQQERQQGACVLRDLPPDQHARTGSARVAGSAPDRRRAEAAVTDQATEETGGTGVRLGMVVLDTPDPRGLAAFYAGLLGWQADPDDEDDDWVTPPGRRRRPRLAFQLAPDLPRPTWPGPGVPQQSHLDLYVASYDEPERRALAMGATLLDASFEHPSFRVYADPTGHPFCLCLE